MTKGITGERSGLVAQVFRLVEEQRTPWVLLENVPFMLQLARGEAMHVITSAFEELGYSWAYRVIDARSFGLPQRRRRVYLLASRVGDPRTVLFADEAGTPEPSEVNGHPVACGFYWTEGLRGLGWAIDAVPTLKGGSTIGIPSPPAILMPDGRVVTPDIRDAERLQGFPRDWTKPAERVAKRGARWKLVGNAVSVPAAAWIGRRLVRPGKPKDFEVFALKDHRHWPTAAWNIGDGRCQVIASEWPSCRPVVPLQQFLRHDLTPLSAKATNGFLQRANIAKLNFPVGLIEALRAHHGRMTSGVPSSD
jgi:DNA (cytosine-5)-methyltransferase 1